MRERVLKDACRGGGSGAVCEILVCPTLGMDQAREGWILGPCVGGRKDLFLLVWMLHGMPENQAQIYKEEVIGVGYFTCS